MALPEFPGINTDYLTTADLAERWRCSVDTIYRIDPVLLPYTKPTHARLYAIEDVLAYERSSYVGKVDTVAA